MGDRIAKVMARRGLCSRREAERWILSGRVSVNGVVILTPALTVSDDDRVVVDGKSLKPQSELRVWKFYKRKGLITTHKDPEGRPTVFEHLPTDLPRVVSVGRLDFNSEGLLLLTTHGGLAQHLSSPRTAWIRTYRVRLFDPGDSGEEMYSQGDHQGYPQGRGSPSRAKVSEKALEKFTQGIVWEGMRYRAVSATLDHRSGSNVWVTIKLDEGKNREIRKMCESQGWSINRLIRTSFGPFTLDGMEPGECREIPKGQLQSAIDSQAFQND